MSGEVPTSRGSGPRRSAWRLLADAWFTADVRSLAAARIGTALVLLFDLARRARHLTAHYTDAGVLPRALIFDDPDWTARLSLHLLGGSTAFQAAMFVLAAVVAVCLLVGYRTRVATLVSFVLLVSLHTRNPEILFGGDNVLKLMLFWGLFLPWGDAFALDARHLAPERRRRLVCSGGVAALMIQVAIIYILNANLKNGLDWRRDYTALYFALSLEAYATPLGEQLHRWPALMKVLTFQTLWLETLAPILLFSPIFTRSLRTVGVILVMGLHVGILATMHVHFFPVIDIVALFVFLPPRLWSRLAARRGGGPVETPPPAIPRAWHRSPRDIVPLVLAIYVLLWSMPIPDALRTPGRILGIHQGWAMFAPSPMREDGWWSLEGTLADGRIVDLLADGAEPGQRPANVLGHYGATRWRKYYENLLKDRTEPEFSRFHEYYCRRWNAAHGPGETVVEVEPVFYLELNLSDYRTAPVKRYALGRRSC